MFRYRRLKKKSYYYRPVVLVRGLRATEAQFNLGTFYWAEFLSQIDKPNDSGETVDGSADMVVPVECFQCTPFQNHIIHYYGKRLVVEAPVHKGICSQVPKGAKNHFWFASVRKVAGYRLLLRYIGVDEKEGTTNDFWMSIGSANLKHIGYCGENPDERVLVAPDIVANKQKEWESYAISQLHDCYSIGFHWYDIQKKELQNCKFVVGNRVELLDTRFTNRVLPAIVEKISGHRVFVQLSKEDILPEPIDDEQDEGIWLEQDSPLLFYVGWSSYVHYQLYANRNYKQHAEEVAAALNMGSKEVPVDRCDASHTLFTAFTINRGENEEIIDWKVGMRMEVLDPADTYKELRCGTVLELLRDGFLKIGFKGEEEDEDAIPLHCSSPLLFPVGYAKEYNIKLKGPEDNYVTFHDCNGKAAPEVLFDSVERHKERIQLFKLGAKLEATDMCDTQLICPASVVAHKGRLLEISFDGWDESYNQLVEFRSNNIFPLGWCEMYGCKLEPPEKVRIPV